MAPPDVAFRAQHVDPDDQAGEILRRLLTDPKITQLDIVVAWARYRGLARVEDELRDFAQRGHSRIIVGIDERGGTGPGLLAAHELFTEAFVYHEHGAGTFHPKVYLASGGERAVLLVGSSNATPGGLFLNHEASLEATFEIPLEDAHPALESARAYVQRLLDDTDVCRPITPTLVDELVADVRLHVAPHENLRPRGGVALSGGAETEDLDEGGSDVADADAVPIFGRSKHGQLPVPALPLAAKAKLAGFSQEADEAASGSGAGAGSGAGGGSGAGAGSGAGGGSGAGAGSGAGVVVRSWSREMDGTAAQRPPGANSKPTGNIRLTQSDDGVDQTKFFRYDLFGAETWTPTTDKMGNAIDEASIPMEVVLLGQNLGVRTFRVTHATHREAHQGNHTTVIHTSAVRAEFKATNFDGRTLTLSKYANGRLRFEIS